MSSPSTPPANVPREPSPELPVLGDIVTAWGVAEWLYLTIVGGMISGVTYDGLKAWFNRKGTDELPQVRRAALDLVDQRTDLSPEMKQQLRLTLFETFDKLEREL